MLRAKSRRIEFLRLWHEEAAFTDVTVAFFCGDAMFAIYIIPDRAMDRDIFAREIIVVFRIRKEVFEFSLKKLHCECRGIAVCNK